MSTSKIIVEGLIDQINKDFRGTAPRILISRSIDFTGPTCLIELHLEAIKNRKQVGAPIKVAKAFNKTTPVDWAIENCYAELLKQVIKSAIFPEQILK